MWFYIMMFTCNLLIPIVMLICGFFMSKYPPKEINGIIGYRTTMSRKNMDTWKFAHDYCGKLWLKLGLLLLIANKCSWREIVPTLSAQFNLYRTKMRNPQKCRLEY